MRDTKLLLLLDVYECWTAYFVVHGLMRRLNRLVPWQLYSQRRE